MPGAGGKCGRARYYSTGRKARGGQTLAGGDASEEGGGLDRAFMKRNGVGNNQETGMKGAR